MVRLFSTVQDESEGESPTLMNAVKQSAQSDDLVIVDPVLKEKFERQENPPLEQEVVRESEAPEPIFIREKKRVLFLSYEQDVFQEGSLAQAQYVALGAFFEEVHVIVFTPEVHTFVGLQLAVNVWAYPTNTNRWWKYPFDAFFLAREQLYFATFFRADVVVARDPFELSLAAYVIARWFQKPLIVYANSHAYDEHFLDEHDDNSYRVWWAHQCIKRAEKVITTTDRLKKTVLSHHDIPDENIAVVPPHVELSVDVTHVSRDLFKKKYPAFNFTFLIVSSFEKGTHVDFVINALQFTLRQYRSMGLFIIGDGPERATVEALVKSKGLDAQVIFLGDVASEEYIASAGVVISLTDDEEAERTLFSAVTLGVPVITSTGLTLGGVLEHEVTALICKSGDLGCAIQSVTRYMNNSAERLRFAKEAKTRLEANSTSRTDSLERFVSVVKEVVNMYEGVGTTEQFPDVEGTEVSKQDTL